MMKLNLLMLAILATILMLVGPGAHGKPAEQKCHKCAPNGPVFECDGPDGGTKVCVDGCWWGYSRSWKCKKDDGLKCVNSIDDGSAHCVFEDGETDCDICRKGYEDCTKIFNLRLPNMAPICKKRVCGGAYEGCEDCEYCKNLGDSL